MSRRDGSTLGGRVRPLGKLLVALGPLVVPHDASAARSGLLPTAPPVHVHTGPDASYWGIGVLRLGVSLPYVAEPEFSLTEGGADFAVGDAVYTATGVGVALGELTERRSIEYAVLGGPLGGELATDSFAYSGWDFAASSERKGGFGAFRIATARRVAGRDHWVLDVGFTQLVGLYALGGDTRVESEPDDYGNRYLSEWHESTVGLAWRPVVTLQPTISAGPISVIPFVGLSAFVDVSSSRWEVREWQDVLYGPDCADGCRDGNVNGHLLGDYFGGFDVDLRFTRSDRVALSSLFRPPSPAQDSPVSELYVVYARSF